MLVAVFRRRLKEGATFEDFISAWEADKGFGVPARVFNAVSLTDDREILSVGFVDIDASAFEALAAGVSDQEAVRHSRIDDVIESTELRAFYDLRTEHDFSADPREIVLGSPESLLAALARG
ncbi:MAG: hypothetical protein ACKOB9_01515 [Solirubrobacterales bacterium]